MNRRSFFNLALACVGTFAAAGAAEAMPVSLDVARDAAVDPTGSPFAVGGAEVERAAVVVVRRRRRVRLVRRRRVVRVMRRRRFVRRR